METKIFRLTIFYSKPIWHHLLKWFHEKCVKEAKCNNFVVYLSTYRGDSISLTFEENQCQPFVIHFLEELSLFLFESPSEKERPRYFNNAIFKDFSSSEVYYGIHEEVIDNFKYEKFAELDTQVKVLTSKVLIEELKDAKIDDISLIGLAILFLRLIEKALNYEPHERKVFYNAFIERKIAVNQNIFSNVLNYTTEVDKLLATSDITEELLALKLFLDKAYAERFWNNDDQRRSVHRLLIGNIRAQLGLENSLLIMILQAFEYSVSK
jgi:hypothetical protein